VNWILEDAPHRTRETVRKFAIGHRLIDVILGMAEIPHAVCGAAEDAPILAEDPAASQFEGEFVSRGAEIGENGVALGDCSAEGAGGGVWVSMFQRKPPCRAQSSIGIHDNHMTRAWFQASFFPNV
jgi:hypothetical protein